MDEAYHDAIIILALGDRLDADDGGLNENDLDTLFQIVKQKEEEFLAAHDCTAGTFLCDYHFMCSCHK